MNTATPTCYQTKAATTRSRRQAKGMYRKPTPAQDAAYRKTLQRNGDKLLTVEEMTLLASHPYLAASQRSRYSQMAQAA